MIGRLKWVFDRYVEHHMEVVTRATTIGRETDDIPGIVEHMSLKNGLLTIEGWCDCDTVTILHGGAKMIRKPWIERQDIVAQLDCRPNVGFLLSLPGASAPLTLIFAKGDLQQKLQIESPGGGEMVETRLRLLVRFVRDLLRGAPSILKALILDRTQFRRAVKSALRLNTVVSQGMLDSHVLRGSNADQAPIPYSHVTIILPVYNAFEVLQECLTRLVANTDLHLRLILVEDHSTDPQVKPWLSAWVAQNADTKDLDIELIENGENLGFVLSVNKGLQAAMAHGDPVVLLNSDALVPKGWDSRLLAPMARDRQVASVTPMSNDAEIFSTPVICSKTQLTDGQVDAMDAHASMLNARDNPVLAPTGVGFCMAMNPDFLKKLPAFDTVFSPGYGEEVDWCNRAAALGGRNVTASNLFVEHRGGESFGSAQKHKLISRNGQTISKRYPAYDAEVQDFIRRDPLATERIALALAYLDTHPDIEDVPVFLAHSMGGGAEHYLRAKLETENRNAAVFLRFGGQMRCSIEVYTTDGSTVASTDDLNDVRDLINRVTKRRIVYSNTVGDSDPIEIPQLLVDLSKDRPLEILFHDYFLLSPSYTLLDDDFVFRGTPVAPRDNPAHSFTRYDGRRYTLNDWQSAWSKAMDRATDVTVFSKDSRKHVATVYPQVADKIRVQPHALISDVPKLDPPQPGKTVIGVLGNIGEHKGAKLLQSLSHKLARIDDVEMVLIGRIDPGFPLHRSVHIHGTYAVADIPEIAKRYNVGVWLIPSLWPETFSYSTHEAIATGMPVLSFDIGAHGDAVAAAPNGIILPGTPDAFLSDESLDRIVEAVQEQTTCVD